MKKLLIGAWSLLMLAACEKPVKNIDIPEAEPKLVVTCFITPGQTDYEAQVTISQPIFQASDGQVKYLPDADVFIRSGSTTLRLTYNAAKKRYTVPATTLPIEPGRTYTLEVNDQEGRSVSASCTVPTTAVETDPIEFFQRQETGSTVTRMVVKWNDIGGQKDYYRLYSEEVHFVDLGPTMDTTYSERSSIMVSDEESDGQKLSTYDEYYSGYYDSTGTPGTPQERQFDVYLLHTDEHYYKYHEGRLRYQGDNPFAEPSIIYSNISGGLGCFGAYMKTIRRVTVTL
jgi:hypothetical protein